MSATAPIRHPALILLAAGAASRMGRPKALLPTRKGRTLVSVLAGEALAAPVWPVVVVLGAHAETIRPALARLPVLVVENVAWSEGMAGSIRRGLETVVQFSRASDGVVIALADQPHLTADVIARLLAAQRATGSPAAAARYGERLAVPAVFARGWFPRLAALRGAEGARRVLAESADEVAAVDLPELAVDLDTPADYAAWLAASAQAAQ